MQLNITIGTCNVSTIKIKKYALLTATLLFSINTMAFADNKDAAVSIPVIENAKVFADFSTEMPAVLNYFTSATETQVIDFYQQSFGTPISQERKRGHLTLSYLQEKQRTRVVISERNNKRQVDIIVEKK